MPCRIKFDGAVLPCGSILSVQPANFDWKKKNSQRGKGKDKDKGNTEIETSRVSIDTCGANNADDETITEKATFFGTMQQCSTNYAMREAMVVSNGEMELQQNGQIIPDGSASSHTREKEKQSDVSLNNSSQEARGVVE
ncbi:MAG: hypothetical protein ACREBR_02690, partial [bacterium]